MIKMIVSDLDGTLLNITHTTNKKVFEAIDLALENGIVFVVATGRALIDNGKSLHFGDRPLYLISNNGAVIKNQDGEIIYKKELPKEFIKATLEKFPHLAFDIVTVDKVLVSNTKDVYIKSFRAEKLLNRLAFKVGRKRFLKYFVGNKEFDASIDKVLSLDVVKMNARVFEEKDKIALKEHISKFEDVINLPFSNSLFEITHKDVNKAEATKFLANSLGIREGEVFVFGDGGNDYPLLEAFENSYAPSNANSKTKSVAKEVLGHYWFGGVPKRMIELIKGQIK